MKMVLVHVPRSAPIGAEHAAEITKHVHGFASTALPRSTAPRALDGEIAAKREDLQLAEFNPRNEGVGSSSLPVGLPRFCRDFVVCENPEVASSDVH
jgi:hypothetical protein